MNLQGVEYKFFEGSAFLDAFISLCTYPMLKNGEHKVERRVKLPKCHFKWYLWFNSDVVQKHVFIFWWEGNVAGIPI